jgi:hypothetical protein
VSVKSGFGKQIMASEFANNPYAAPPIEASLAKQGQDVGSGIFRQGNVLIVHRLAQFPPYCVRTNASTNRFDPWTFRWHPSWVLVTILISPLIYIIVALILTKTMTFQVPVSEYWRGVRFQRILIGWLIATLGTAGSIGAGLLLSGPHYDGPGLLLLIVGPIVCLIAGLIIGSSAKVLTPDKIDGEYTWLKGACPDFLNRFPSA